MRRIALSCILALTFACKPTAAPTSGVQSLDNLAGGKTVNQCHGANAPVPTAVIKANEAFTGEVKRALSALPGSLQSAFFEDLRGQIIVQKNVSACGREVVSCWVPAGDNGTAIYIKQESSDEETVKNIRHALVRSFGYMTTQLFLKLKHEAQGTVLVDNPDLSEFKSDLAMTFLDDVARHPQYKLSTFKSALPSKMLDEDAKTADRRAAWDGVRRSDKGESFMDTVLAETFDSWYCSQESRANFARDFKGTYELMQAYAQTLEMAFDGKLPAAEPNETSGGEGGFGLWGRWGFGNGPIRQAFSNWGSWRASGHGLFNFGRAAQGGGFIFNRGGWGADW